MKKKTLMIINSLLTALLGLFGVSGCYLLPMYGTPHASIGISGSITDQDEQPLENIQVSVRVHRDYDSFCVGYSDEDGRYQWRNSSSLEYDTIDIIVRDTSGVYASDSVRTKLEYDRSQAGWNTWDRGIASVQQDFQLKKK